MKLNPPHIVASIMMKDSYVLWGNDNGTFQPTSEFLDDLAALTESFRQPIEGEIINEIGNDWSVKFKPFITETAYEVFIYCDSKESYEKIVGIIIKNLVHLNLKFDFYYKGVVDSDSQW